RGRAMTNRRARRSRGASMKTFVATLGLIAGVLVAPPVSAQCVTCVKLFDNFPNTVHDGCGNTLGKLFHTLVCTFVGPDCSVTGTIKWIAAIRGGSNQCMVCLNWDPVNSGFTTPATGFTPFGTGSATLNVSEKIICQQMGTFQASVVSGVSGATCGWDLRRVI